MSKKINFVEGMKTLTHKDLLKIFKLIDKGIFKDRYGDLSKLPCNFISFPPIPKTCVEDENGMVWEIVGFSPNYSVYRRKELEQKDEMRGV